MHGYINFGAFVKTSYLLTYLLLLIYFYSNILVEAMGMHEKKNFINVLCFSFGQTTCSNAKTDK